MARLKTVAWLIIAGLVAYACGGSAGPSANPSAAGAATASAVAADPIRVTFIGTFTGQNADLGNWMWNGVKLAIDEANAAGGVSGRKIDLIKYDDQGQPTIATDLAQRAISEKTVMVYGSNLSTLSLAMIPILSGAKIPQITSGQAPALLQQNSPYIFIDSTTSVVFDRTLANYVVSNLKITSIAMITNNGTYGKGEHDSFLAEIGKLGVTPTADKVIAPDVKDFTSVLTEIRATNPKALFIGAEEIQSGLIAKQARSLGITATFVGAAPIGTPTFSQTAGNDVSEGSVMTSPYLSNDTNAKTKAFAAAYQKAYGSEATFHGAKANDGMNMFILAMKKTPTDLSGPKLIEAVRSIEYEGLLGKFKYDATGLGLHATQIGIIKAGKIVPVQ
jgi:branched-chain amino acid transport system substrate-binding protein